MDIFQTVILALIQGVTEFLPISSSGHLILPKEVFGWTDQGLAFDVAVHVGTLVAVVVYFRKDVGELIVGGVKTLGGNFSDPKGQLAWFIVAATIPACVFGLLFDDFIESNLRSVIVIATTTIVFGILLGLADKRDTQTKNILDIGLKAAIIIGLAQAVALIPGTSRSGITITAALFLGFNREASAKFSFLMSIPIIILSGGYKGLGLIEAENVDWQALVIGIAVSAISAYICIHYFLGFINRLGMMPFVYYRLALGAMLFALVFAAT